MTLYRKCIAGFLFLLVFALAACSAQIQSTASAPAGLTFVHLNDTYRVGAVEDGNKGGFGRVVTLIRNLQRDGKDVRILHGGDFLYPSLESQLWNGEQMVEAFNFMNSVAPMYVVAGNHEFDRRSPEHLASAIRNADFKWLGDNYRLDSGDVAVDSALQESFTYRHGDLTVGIFSLTLHAADGGNTRDYLDVNPDYLGVARRSIERLAAKDVDLIIGVTHLHMATDIQIAALKQEYPQLAFIVGGHEHEPEYSPATPASAAVMKGASNARIIWQIDVSLDDAGHPVVSGRQLDMDESIAKDEDYEKIVAKWRQRLLDIYPFLESAVGRAALPMDATEQTIRNAETAWGNFIVDQMRNAFGEPRADLAFINSGTLRIDDFIVDDIRFEDIARTFGFSSFLRYLTISGSEFQQLLEAGYRGSGPSKGYFPQVSGFRVCVDRHRESLDRIVSLQVPTDAGWQEIDPDKDYLLVMPDYLFRGGDGYTVPGHRKSSASRPGSELKYLVLDGIIRAQAEGRAIGEAVEPEDPRYVELGAERANCWN